MTPELAQSLASPAIKTVEAAEPTNSVPCGICKRQFSRYTCPKCNLLYCSLVCFRSQQHSNCSEGFYKKELETDIHTNSTKNAEERRAMMDMLKRFEEEAAGDANLLLDPEREHEEDEGLADRLGELDIDNASYEELWAALTPQQQQKFRNALNDPSSEIAQSMLSSAELADEIIQPWWDAAPKSGSRPSISTQRFGQKPTLFDVPPAVLDAAASAASGGPTLLYNIFAVLIAYAYVTRALSTSPLSLIKEGNPEREDARHTLSTLVPFLVDRGSKVVLPSLSGLITDLWSRFETETMTSALFALLMRDAARLLKPLPVVNLTPDTDAQQNQFANHPSVSVILALSDLSSVFQRTRQPSHGTPKTSPSNPCTAKLAFYAARIFHTPTSILTALSNEALARARLIEQEGLEDQKPMLSHSTPEKRPDPHHSDQTRPRIEELP